jgi:hypothetical protein
MITEAAGALLRHLKNKQDMLNASAQQYAVDFARGKNPSHREMFLRRTEEAAIYKKLEIELIPLIHNVELEACELGKWQPQGATT